MSKEYIDMPSPSPSQAEIQQNRQEWIDELNSGKYPQADGYLETPSGFCCLGVACKHFLSRIPGATSGTIGNSVVYYDGTTPFFSYMPSSFRRFLGLNYRTERILAVLNDQQVPFHAIGLVIKLLPIASDPNTWD